MRLINYNLYQTEYISQKCSKNFKNYSAVKIFRMVTISGEKFFEIYIELKAFFAYFYK